MKKECEVFQKILDKFSHGKRDQKTIEIFQDKKPGTMWQIENCLVPGFLVNKHIREDVSLDVVCVMMGIVPHFIKKIKKAALPN